MVLNQALNACGLFGRSFTIYEDIDMILRLALRGSFVVNRQVLASFIRRNEKFEISLTNRATLNSKYRYEVMLQILEELTSSNFLTDTERSLVLKSASEYSFLLALENNKLGNPRTARTLLKRSWLLYPSISNTAKCLLGVLPLQIGNAGYRAWRSVVERNRQL